MKTPPPSPTLYCPRCQNDAHRDEFRTVMAHVPAGFTRTAPALTVLKHSPARGHCGCLVYVPATIHRLKRVV